MQWEGLLPAQKITWIKWHPVNFFIKFKLNFNMWNVGLIFYLILISRPICFVTNTLHRFLFVFLVLSSSLIFWPQLLNYYQIKMFEVNFPAVLGNKDYLSHGDLPETGWRLRHTAAVLSANNPPCQFPRKYKKVHKPLLRESPCLAQ